MRCDACPCVLAVDWQARLTPRQVASFSQRHAPPPPPLGPEIPAGVRTAIAAWFRERGVREADARARFFQKFGYGSLDDIGDDIRARWGEEAYDKFYADLHDDPAVARWHHAVRQRQAAETVASRHLPAPLYLDYLECALDKHVEAHAAAAFYDDHYNPLSSRSTI